MKKYSMRNVIIAMLILTLPLPCIGRGKTYAVIVGISDYKYPGNCPSLHGLTVKSARSAANYFYEKHRSRTFMLLDGNATKEHILRVMKSEFAKADVDDAVIFVFSGHGYQGGVTTYATDGSAQTLISYNEIQGIMRSSKAKRKIVLAEACYSGGFNKSTKRHRSKTQTSEVMIYTSSRANEVSYVPGFMNYVVSGLRGLADANSDNKITARELFNYVNSNVERETGGVQHPQMWGRFSHEMIIAEID